MFKRCALLTALVFFALGANLAEALPSTELPLQPVSVSVGAATGEKPQSKVWTHAGEWWSVLAHSSGTWLRRLDGDTWTDILQVSTSTSAKCDVKADGDTVHVLVFTGASSQLVSAEYVSGTNSYTPWSTRPTPAAISLDGSVETASIDIDSQGRMWVASDASTTIEVRCSDSPYSTWSGPITLESGIHTDDICVVAALPNGTVGVMWSNQNSERYGFRLHVDGADSTVWAADEVPASQSAQAVGGGMADDHLNVAVASDATLYVAVKTSFDTAGYPLVALLVRRPAGTWDDLYEVDQGGTRGIVLLNETTSTVTVVYTDGGIAYRESPTSTIAFGAQQTLMTNGSLNNPTSTKQNISNEVVILASTGSSAEGVFASGSFVNPEGLVGWWPMEEGGGTTLVDSSGYDNDGAISGSPSWVAGAEGQALLLNGTTDYALVPDSSNLDLTSAITLAAWVKPEKAGTQYLIKKAQSGTNGYELSLSATGKAFARLNQASSGNTYRVDSTQPYPIDGSTWTHLALTWDGMDMRLYVDGVLDSTVAAPITLATNSLAVGIGAQSNGTNLFQGAMDDARIYDRAISAGEVAVLANVPPPTGQLVGWWKMEENGGLVLVDSSGAGYDGTISGSPTWVAGQDGLALHLNGTTDYALVPDAPGLDITDSLTLAAWIKPEKTGTQYLVKKAIQSGGDGYELSLSATGKAFARLNQTTSGNDYRIDTTVLYPIDGSTWMHLALTWDGANMRLYVNGILDSTRAAVTTIASNALALGIGTQSNGTNLFQGAMDDVRVYGRALSAAEIAALQGTPPGNQAPVAICQNVVAVVDSTSGCLATVDTSQVDNGSYDPDTDPITMVLEPAGPYAVGVNAVQLIVSDGSLSDTCSATITVSCPAAPELVGWWKMEEGSGAVLVDSSGLGNNANTVGTPSWVCGIDRQSLVLDGANDYALAPDNASLDVTNAITLAAWIKPSKLGTQYLVKKATINGTDGYELSLSNPGKAFVRFNQNTSANTYRLDSISSYPTTGNTWMHLAATYDGSTIRMYVNGIEENTSSPASFTIATNTLPLGIGAQSDGATKLQGAIDEVRVYNGALSPTEILALATAPPANTPPVAVCQNVSVTIPSGPCSATVDPSQVDNGSSDPDGDPFTMTLEPAGPYTAGVTAVDLIVSDGCDTDTCSATITVNCPPPNPHGLVGWWPMEEGSGASVLDSSGYENDGAISGAPTWDTGHDGLALVLDGTNDYALVPDSPSLDVTSAITLAAWIKPSKSGTQYVLKKANIGVTDGYELSLSTSGLAFVRFNQFTSSNDYRVNSTTSYPTDGNTWMHLVATYDGTTIRLYVDGVEENFSTQSFTIVANNLPLGIGAQSDGATKLQGAIDEARVYERALSPGEIDSLFTLGAPGQDLVEAQPASGICISTAIPCVTVPVVFTRSDSTDARGASVTFRLSPELELCGGSLSSITVGTWLQGFGATFEVTDNGDSSYTVDQTILGMPCGVSTGGTLFEIQVQAGTGAAPDDAGTITVESVIVRDCNNLGLPGDPGAAATVPIDRTGPVIGDLSASQVKTGNLPADGTTKIMLSWTPPESGTTVQVFGKGYGNYPEYDDAPGSGVIPTAPADSADAVGNGWVLTGVTQPGETDETNAARDFWYFVAIATDSCGNVGSVSGLSNGALNYHLGDVAPLGVLGDNEVELLDISRLGMSYGTQYGESLYVDTLDVGPTTDFSVDALPTTDDWIEFEDLMMFALNFSNVSAPGGVLPVTAGTPAVRVATASGTGVGDILEVDLVLASHGKIQGVSVPLRWNPSVVEPVGFQTGAWMLEQPGQSVVLSPQPGTVDATLFGSTIAGEGTLATVRFRVIGEGDPGLRLGNVRARDARNRPVEVALEMVREPIGTVTPLVNQMGPGSPNPFRSGTAFALSLAKEGPVKIQVYGLNGRLVRTLLDAVLPAERHQITWDGRDAFGRKVASGAYLIHMVTPTRTQTQRVVRIR